MTGSEPFLEAQVEIRKKLKDDGQKRQETEFVAKVKARTPVWTVFDAPDNKITGGHETVVGRPTPQPR